MNSSSMRERLSQFIAALRQQILAMPDDAARLPRFDRQLFLSKGTRLQDYLAEIEQNFQQLCQNNEQPERAVWLAGRLVDQIAALQREASTQTLRLRRERPAPDRRRQKRDEYREYERRLQAMVDEREQRLALAETLAVQQQLKRELEALEGRLARCRQALRAVEWQRSLRPSPPRA
ncbi:primosomal replication protein [Pantoea sp.]|uniref:primosomal replication protein n=2 Tax=Pantoea sp. TaxID=69393 RepID=UPI00289F3931|nr:primosomal replication protein [Pantoea sp.]